MGGGGVEITFSCSIFVFNYYIGREFSYLTGVAAFLLKLRHSFMFPRNIFSTTNTPAALGQEGWLGQTAAYLEIMSLTCGVVCFSVYTSCPFISESSPAMNFRLVSISLSTSMYDQTPHFSILITVWGLGLLLVLQTPQLQTHSYFLSCQSGLTNRSSGERPSWDLKKQERIDAMGSSF